MQQFSQRLVLVAFTSLVCLRACVATRVFSRTLHASVLLSTCCQSLCLRFTRAMAAMFWLVYRCPRVVSYFLKKEEIICSVPYVLLTVRFVLTLAVCVSGVYCVKLRNCF